MATSGRHQERKPTVWVDHEVPYYTASALGGCLRALVAARMGYEPVYPRERLLEIYAAGHESEDACLVAMEQAGWRFCGLSQAEARLPVNLSGNRRVIVLGHIDEEGIPPGEDEPVIVEVKSQGPSAWDDYARHGPRGPLWERYSWQASVYMLAREKPLCWVRWRRGSPDETVAWAVHRLVQPPHSFAELVARLEVVEDHAAAGTFPPCPEGQANFDCPFRYLHGDEEEPEDLGRVVEVEGLLTYAMAYESARRAEKDAAERKEQARAKLLELLAAAGHEGKVRARDGAALVVVSTSHRKYLDEQALAEALGDLAPYWRAGPEVTRVSVRLAKGWAG